MRRMLTLFLFGVLHIIFVWSGDVIHLYATLGISTMLLLRLPNHVILISAVIIFVFPFYEDIGQLVFNLLDYRPEIYLKDYTFDAIIATIRQGSYVDGIARRVAEYRANIPVLIVYLAPIAFSMFLLGMYFGKKGYIHQLKEIIIHIKNPTIYILILSNLYRICFLFLLPNTELYKDVHWRPIFLKLMYISDLLMGLGYLWVLGYLWYYTNCRRFLYFLKYPGKMALTNYILHSVAGLILFTSVGFSLYQTMSPLMTLSIAIFTFILQVLFSRVWLIYFQYGPLEWLWRCISYKQLMPLKK